MEEPLILDRYRPLAELGSGGHGSVVLAFDTKMARRVAVKRLPLPRTRSGAVVPRTGLAEARTAALLNHPSIVTVHEWDTDSDEAFIVMEDLDGASLADLLDETGQPFTLDEAAAIVSAVMAGVAYAHSNGVLHLDLKPGNVLVTREGRVKVADFGVSALTDASGRAEGTAGTIGYMPPEQIRAQELDERTDCWALAALVYELLANANPFDADTAEGSLFKIEVAEVPAPSEFEPSLPEEIDDVLLAALSPDPAERYPGVTDLGRALLRYLGDPEAGQRSLSELVSGAVAEEPEDEYAYLGLWDRLAPYAGRATRLGAAAASGWLGWAGIAHLGVGSIPALLAAALIALAGALAPGLGLALGLAAFALGLGSGASVIAGVLFGALAAAFWAGRGRLGWADGLAPIAAPLLGIVRASTSIPLLLGFVFEPVAAAFAAGAAALALTAASAITGGTAPLLGVNWRFALNPVGQAAATNGFLERVLDPGVGVTVLAWMGAAAVCSFACRRASRAAGFAGVLLGGMVLTLGYAGWGWLSGGAVGPAAFAPDLVIGIGIALLVASLGAPTRPEEPESRNDTLT